MSDARFYRSEAERCLKWAEACLDPEVARRRRALASDYNALAEKIARAILHVVPTSTGKSYAEVITMSDGTHGAEGDSSTQKQRHVRCCGRTP